jgi:arylsulfatase A-like enzyme
MFLQSSSGLGLLPVLAGALLLAPCSGSGPGAPERPNLVLVLVDTLRADHLGVYGYPRDTSRNVDAFARESLLFASSRSQSSCTFPSVNSILTSRSPTLFLGQPGHAIGIPAEVPSVAGILQKNGYRTAAISGSPIMRSTPHPLNPRAGFGRGFDTFEEECLWRPAACLNRLALKHLRREDGRPFFLYLHYIDPHDPYRPPRSERRDFRFARRRASEKKFIRQGDPTPIAERIYNGKPDPGATPADLQHLIDLYDEEIAYFDRRFGELLGAVRAAGLLDDTILVFTADHGEDFLEHGHIKHCRTLFDTSIKTPLIVRIPGVEPRVITAPVQNLDIVPTLLDYAGLDTAGFRFEGRSLRALIEGREDGEAWQQFASQVALRSASDGRFKLIHNLKDGKFWLYEVAADPQETKDILTRERRSFHHLRETMNVWLARTEGEGAAGESVRRAEEAEARLRALGYLQ